MAMESANSVTDIQPDVTMATAPIQQPTLDPVARPIPIRFEKPGIAHDPNIESLARGLSEFDSGLQDLVQSREGQQDQADTLKAQADAMKAGSQGYAMGVQAGTIPASASPAYVNAYKESQGQLAGQDLEDKFQAAYDGWTGKDSTDPKAYSSFVQDFFTRNVTTQDQSVLKGLVPVMHQISQNGYRQHIEQQHQSTVEGFSNTQAALVNNGIAAAVGYAKTAGSVVDPDYIANAVIGPAYNNARAVGVSPDQAAKNAILQITTAALTNKDSAHGDEILQALNKPLPGSGIVLAQTNEGAEALERTQNALDTAHRETILHSSETMKAQDKQALGGVETGVLQSLFNNPGQPIDENTLKAGEKLDPTFRLRVVEWTKTMQERGGVSDPQGMVNLERDIMNGAGADAVTHAMDLGVIKNPKDIQEMMGMVKEQAAATPIMKDLQSSPAYKSVQETIKQETAVKDIGGGTGLEKPGLGLEYELDRRMQSWAAQNPGANYAQVQDQFAKTSADVLKLITSPSKFGFTPAQVQPVQGNPYLQGGPAPSSPPSAPSSPTSGTPGSPVTPPTSSAPGMPSPAPATTQPTSALPQSSTQPGATAPGTTAFSPPTSATSVTAPVSPQEIQQWVDKLSPAQQENLARASLRTGRPSTDIAAETYQGLVTSGKVQRPMTGVTGATGASPGMGGNPQGNVQSPNPTMTIPAGTYQRGSWEEFGDAVQKWRQTDPNAEATIHQLAGTLTGLHGSLPYTGSTTLAAIKDNPQAAHILDFVSGPESNGNYNAYYGHADNQSVDFSKMSINEVLKFQHDLVSVDHSPSSATGRYQFMPKTLQGLMGQMGLSGNERFTPELQDSLALQLLKNRGLEQWQQGKLSDAGFMNNLAYEWASLPNPSTGRSQYSGDGLNKSLVTPNMVGNMLTGAKGLPGATPPTHVGGSPTNPIVTDPEPSVAQIGDTTPHPKPAGMSTDDAFAAKRAASTSDMESLVGLRADTADGRSKLKAWMHTNGVEVDPANLAWCASLVNASLQKNGMKGAYTAGGNDATTNYNGNPKYAPNFRTWGQPVAPTAAQRGDVAVFNNGDHVGVLTGDTRQGAHGVEYKMIAGNEKMPNEAAPPKNRQQWGGVGYAWVSPSQVSFRRGNAPDDHSVVNRTGWNQTTQRFEGPTTGSPFGKLASSK